MEHEAYFAGVMAMRGLCDNPSVRAEYIQIKEDIQSGKRNTEVDIRNDTDLARAAVLAFTLDARRPGGRLLFDSKRADDETIPNRYRIREGVQHAFFATNQPRPPYHPTVADEQGYVDARTIDKWLSA